MTPNQVANILESLILIASITVLLLTLWAAARLDALRQDLFIIRDELFDYAHAGNIGFNDPAYRLLRQLMNGMLRYAHQLTFFRISITMFQIKVLGENLDSQWSHKWDVAQARVSPKVREDLNLFHARAMSRVAGHIVYGSPVLIFLAACAFLVLGLRQRWHNIRELFASAPEKALSRVFDTQIIENQAAATAA